FEHQAWNYYEDDHLLSLYFDREDDFRLSCIETDNPGLRLFGEGIHGRSIEQIRDLMQRHGQGNTPELETMEGGEVLDAAVGNHAARDGRREHVRGEVLLADALANGFYNALPAYHGAAGQRQRHHQEHLPGRVVGEAAHLADGVLVSAAVGRTEANAFAAEQLLAPGKVNGHDANQNEHNQPDTLLAIVGAVKKAHERARSNEGEADEQGWGLALVRLLEDGFARRETLEQEHHANGESEAQQRT
nr:hypothetical protein [Tanacetum cinerariifolium]